jgi:hypothetical protein
MDVFPTVTCRIFSGGWIRCWKSSKLNIVLSQSLNLSPGNQTTQKESKGSDDQNERKQQRSKKQ